MSFGNITEEGMLEAIRSINVKESAVVDGIPPYFFKRYVELLAYALTKLLSATVQSITFASLLKIGRITPTYEGGKPNIIENYWLSR